MKKILKFNDKTRVVIELKEVKNLSAETIESEDLYVLGLMGQAIINGKLKTGNISEFLPDTDLGKTLKALWIYNQNYTFGTNIQMELLSNCGVKFDLKDKNSFIKAIDCLKENHLLKDRGVTFGEKTLINPLPLDIINLAKSVIA